MIIYPFYYIIYENNKRRTDLNFKLRFTAFFVALILILGNFAGCEALLQGESNSQGTNDNIQGSGGNDTPPNDTPSGDSNGSSDTVAPDGGDGDYVFGSEYSPITVEEAKELAEAFTTAASGEKYYIVATLSEIKSLSSGQMYITDGTGTLYVYKSTYADGSSLSTTDLAVGDVLIIGGTLRNYKGTLEIEKGTVIDFYTPGEDTPIKPDGEDNGDDSGNTGGNDDSNDENTDDFSTDPYIGMSESEFYASYKPATCLKDAQYRSKHYFLSGTLGEQDQEPTVSDNRPKENGKYIRNTSAIYEDSGNTYIVLDSDGNEAFRVYRGGAYIMLEEVAAYVYAFGTIPANHVSSKNTEPYESSWGIYLRLNHSKFSGDTSKYPYEPKLPDISGCGGSLIYYEMDIGTTGTDCDPSYDITDYNNGSTITRGAARIVYTRYDKNGNGVIEIGECYVFYTYNHYNDFQEYLNYEGGWGEMFGNITGGGTLSSKKDYNPTPYVLTAYRDFSANFAAASVEIVAILPDFVNYSLNYNKRYL